jgi:hypothetical protein
MNKRVHQTEEYAFLSIKVDSYESAVGTCVNVDLRTSAPLWQRR